MGNFAPPTPKTDRSSTVTILNNTKAELRLISSEAIHGYWATNPPSVIGSVSSGSNKGEFLLKDHFGWNGSQGKVTYASRNHWHRHSYTFNFHGEDRRNKQSNTASGSPAEGDFYVETLPLNPDGPLKVTFTVNGHP